ncbi:hypothetical protein ACLKA7_009691 [Drosophila subpalustris]
MPAARPDQTRPHHTTAQSTAFGTAKFTIAAAQIPNGLLDKSEGSFATCPKGFRGRRRVGAAFTSTLATLTLTLTPTLTLTLTSASTLI